MKQKNPIILMNKGMYVLKLGFIKGNCENLSLCIFVLDRCEWICIYSNLDEGKNIRFIRIPGIKYRNYLLQQLFDLQ